jgi:hypothetical protein
MPYPASDDWDGGMSPYCITIYNVAEIQRQKLLISTFAIEDTSLGEPSQCRTHWETNIGEMKNEGV